MSDDLYSTKDGSRWKRTIVTNAVGEPVYVRHTRIGDAPTIPPLRAPTRWEAVMEAAASMIALAFAWVSDVSYRVAMYFDKLADKRFQDAVDVELHRLAAKVVLTAVPDPAEEEPIENDGHA